MWEIHKYKLYDIDSGSGVQLHSQSSCGERNHYFSFSSRLGQKVKFGQNGRVHLGLNVSSSAHNCWCVYDGSNMSIILLMVLILSYSYYNQAYLLLLFVWILTPSSLFFRFIIKVIKCHIFGEIYKWLLCKRSAIFVYFLSFFISGTLCT